jgi:flagellar brake protein
MLMTTCTEFHSLEDSSVLPPLPQEDACLDDGLVYGQRMTSPLEIQRLLDQLIADGSLITLSNPEGASYATTLWSTHPDRDTISLGAKHQDPNLDRLLAGSEVIAEAYLDSIKLQFSVDSMIKVKGAITAINARYPSEIIRLQRRSYFRVKPLKSAAPVATLHHPAIPEMTLNLRILDISLGGVALALAKDVPTFPAGIRMSGCKLQLDSTSLIQADLVIHHITVLNAETEETRLGCEVLGLSSDAEQTLLTYINHTQKRQYAIKR